MIVKQDFLNKLKDFGLNSYESKLWTSLLSRGISSAGELSDIANVPRSRTYDVLESLEKKGFIIMKIGKPIKYIAVPPEEVVERVKSKIQEDANSQTKILEELRNSEVLEELNLLHTQGIDMIDPCEMSGMLKGRKNLYNHLESMINSAEHSIVLVSSEEGLVRKANAFLPALKKAKQRGTAIRIASNLSKEAKEKLSHLAPIADIRHSDMNGRFMIVDGKNVTFTLSDGENTHSSYDSGIWVKTPFFAQSFADMFERLWGGMKPLK
ncbi:MAG: TrmB family transcriptional regulator [Nanobdellota archaeon]